MLALQCSKIRSGLITNKLRQFLLFVRNVINLIYVIFRLLLSALGNFRIVQPFPQSIYPNEFTSAQVTCVAFDSSGQNIPERIHFMRKTRFGAYIVLTENDNLYFTHRMEVVDQGRCFIFKNNNHQKKSYKNTTPRLEWRMLRQLLSLRSTK